MLLCGSLIAACSLSTSVLLFRSSERDNNNNNQGLKEKKPRRTRARLRAMPTFLKGETFRFIFFSSFFLEAEDINRRKFTHVNRVCRHATPISTRMGIFGIRSNSRMILQVPMCSRNLKAISFLFLMFIFFLFFELKIPPIPSIPRFPGIEPFCFSLNVRRVMAIRLSSNPSTSISRDTVGLIDDALVCWNISNFIKCVSSEILDNEPAINCHLPAYLLSRKRYKSFL